MNQKGTFVSIFIEVIKGCYNLQGQGDDMKQPTAEINGKKLKKAVIRARKGDKKAREQIVELTYGYVSYYCLKMLQSKENAKDATQDIFMTVLEKLDSVEKPEAFLGWLKQVTVNRCRNLVTRQHAVEALTDDYLDDTAQITPVECLETEEIRSIIRQAVDGLPDVQRECVLLYYYQQLSIKEIAGLLEVKEGTVKSRLHTARKTIKKWLEREGYDGMTCGGVMPMSLISYSLFSEAKELGAKTSVFLKLGSSEIFIASQAAKSAVGVGVGVKIAAVSCAGAAAVAGTGAFYAIQSGGLQTNDAHYTDTQQIPAESREAQAQGYMPYQPTEEELWEQFYANGFTDADKRKPLFFRQNEGLNSANNKAFVFDRMCNCADFFDTIQGTYYEFVRAVPENEGSMDRAEYTSYCGDIQKRRAKTIHMSADGMPISYDLYKYPRVYSTGYSGDYKPVYLAYNAKTAEKANAERSRARLNELARDNYVDITFESTEYNFFPFVAVSSRRKLMQIEGEEDSYTYYVRPNVFSFPDTQYQPEPLLYRMDMLQTDSWQITKTTTMLGRDCFVINGKANEVFDIASYTLTVDKETGALLAYELYDADGALMRQLITYEFKVNEPLSDEIFDNTEKVTMPPFSTLPDE